MICKSFLFLRERERERNLNFLKGDGFGKIILNTTDNSADSLMS